MWNLCLCITTSEGKSTRARPKAIFFTDCNKNNVPHVSLQLKGSFGKHNVAARFTDNHSQCWHMQCNWKQSVQRQHIDRLWYWRPCNTNADACSRNHIVKLHLYNCLFVFLLQYKCDSTAIPHTHFNHLCVTFNFGIYSIWFASLYFICCSCYKMGLIAVVCEYKYTTSWACWGDVHHAIWDTTILP